MRVFLALLSLCISSFAFAGKPNIVLFLADDLGWTGLGSFGSDFYETPNLDRLADKGVKFTQAYSACTVCSPTRASIMTGMHPARLHLTDFIPGQNRPFTKMTIPDWTAGLEKRHITIAEALQASGYRTIHLGKWHLDFQKKTKQGPTHHGFDVSYRRNAQREGYYIDEETVESLGLDSNYSTDYLTDKAIEEIKASEEQPFFLYFAYNIPHTPIQGREDLVRTFESKRNENAIHNNATYAAMVKSLDVSAGRVLETLEAQGVAENTLVLFLSDNGGLTQRYGVHDRFTENLPLRRGKGSAYEGGVRVPAIAYWPGVTPEGVVSDTAIVTTDLYPTFLEVAGIGGMAKRNGQLDGSSLLPLLENPEHAIERDLYWHYPHYHAGGDGPYSAVRSGEWRLVEFLEDGSLELYNLKYDISESTNLAYRHIEKRMELKAKLDQWRASVSAQMPTPNPNFDPERQSQVVRTDH